MKVTIKVRGFPDVEAALGGNRFMLEVEGSTFGDVLAEMDRQFGEDNRKALMVQVLLNSKYWVKVDALSTPVQDGNTLSFSNMVAGG
ncbi:MoaD/ThiS family protein [Anoxynatronum buryatiense]|uniref:ThiS family protein n=1 Tax=Anoxynatronum buryatiense TaxID=489973 RepID=A0AA46AIR6_9CLOT|nr:MoaD/ThiS family protein [Anoxynatronum buryatiense]SMP53802.1 ThiS family protein [Anoxynatronum buryatiense]